MIIQVTNFLSCVRSDHCKDELQSSLGPQKKFVMLPSPRPTVKCEKTGSGFFFFLCQIWAKNLLKFVFNGLKKHLYIRVLTAFRPSFPHLETLKKILENSTLSWYVKKKKSTDRPNFQILVGWGQHNNFFFWPYNDHSSYKFSLLCNRSMFINEKSICLPHP